MTIKELNNMLALKLQNEFSKYTQDLINNKTSQEIVMKSYETTVKEGYIDLFSYKDLEKDEIKALLKEENILDSLYDDWNAFASAVILPHTKWFLKVIKEWYWYVDEEDGNGEQKEDCLESYYKMNAVHA